MWLYDLLLITDGRIPVKIRFSNGVETEIDSDNWLNKEYKHYYVLHITKEDDCLIYHVEISFEV